MRDYEVVYIFKSSLGTEEIESRVQTYHEKILAGSDAAITAIVHWGKRELAYPIDKERNGYYVVAQFSAPPDVLPAFERALKFDDDLLRHLVVISEGELPTPPVDTGELGRDDDRPSPRLDDDGPQMDEDIDSSDETRDDYSSDDESDDDVEQEA
jgi:small subunit ribosomal protein S6